MARRVSQTLFLHCIYCLSPLVSTTPHLRVDMEEHFQMSDLVSCCTSSSIRFKQLLEGYRRVHSGLVKALLIKEGS